MTTGQYKRLKGLKKENLRDNMSTTELILTMLAENSTKEISQRERPEGFEESCEVAQRGGGVAHIARQALEAETGTSVVTAQDAMQLNAVVTSIIELAAESQPDGPKESDS